MDDVELTCVVFDLCLNGHVKAAVSLVDSAHARGYTTEQQAIHILKEILAFISGEPRD